MTIIVPANTFPDANTQIVLSAFKDSFTAIVTLQIFGSVLWAIYLVIFAYTLRILLKKGLRTRGQKIVCGSTILLFVCSTVLRVLISMEAIMAIRGALGSREMTWAARVEYVDVNVHAEYQFGIGLVYFINVVIGDSLVIWRAWVIWRGERYRKVIYLPIFLLVASFAFGMVTVACWSPDAFGSTVHIRDVVCASTAFPTGWALSLLANIFTTFLIAFKAWRHRNFIKTTAVGRRQRSMADKVMLVFVESGALYNLVWIAQIFQFPFVKAHLKMENPTIYIVTQTVAAIGYQLIGLYPTIIVLMVNRHSSITEVMDPTLSFRIVSVPSSQISLNAVANARR